MPVIEHKQFIRAPIELCFNLARSVDIHVQTNAKTMEKAVSGRTEGLLEEGDTVTWEAVHFGLKQKLISKVIFLEVPDSFVTVMVKGILKSYIHIHQFAEEKDGTSMVNHFQYKAPFGPIGILADKLFLEKYMNKLIANRAEVLKEIAEERADTNKG